jgi:hypothetical protein
MRRADDKKKNPVKKLEKPKRGKEESVAEISTMELFEAVRVKKLNPQCLGGKQKSQF